MTTEAKAQHTPGPWKQHSEDSMNLENGLLIRGADDSWLADVHWFPDDRPTKAEAEANARLIAAAPDLLETLKRALLSFEEMAEPGRFGASIVRAWLENSATARQITAAIAKATGKED